MGSSRRSPPSAARMPSLSVTSHARMISAERRMLGPMSGIDLSKSAISLSIWAARSALAGARAGSAAGASPFSPASLPCNSAMSLACVSAKSGAFRTFFSLRIMSIASSTSLISRARAGVTGSGAAVIGAPFSVAAVTGSEGRIAGGVSCAAIPGFAVCSGDGTGTGSAAAARAVSGVGWSTMAPDLCSAAIWSAGAFSGMRAAAASAIRCCSTRSPSRTLAIDGLSSTGFRRASSWVRTCPSRVAAILVSRSSTPFTLPRIAASVCCRSLACGLSGAA